MNQLFTIAFIRAIFLFQLGEDVSVFFISKKRKWLKRVFLTEMILKMTMVKNIKACLKHRATINLWRCFNLTVKKSFFPSFSLLIFILHLALVPSGLIKTIIYT